MLLACPFSTLPSLALEVLLLGSSSMFPSPTTLELSTLTAHIRVPGGIPAHLGWGDRRVLVSERDAGVAGQAPGAPPQAPSIIQGQGSCTTSGLDVSLEC